MEDEEVSQVSTVWIFYSTGISVKSNLEVIPTENLLFLIPTENLLFFSSGSFSGTCITSGGKIPTYVLRNLCFYKKNRSLLASSDWKYASLVLV